MATPRDPAEDSCASRAAQKSLPCLKGKFPFQLATTSYIIPSDLLSNIRFLGPYVDEVELVLFESQDQSNLPTPEEVREMARLAADLALTYNVHLPGDLFLGDPDPTLRREFCITAVQYYERTLPLEPTSYVLHLDSRAADGTIEKDQGVWQGRVSESLETMRAHGIDLSRMVVENLEYPLDRLSSLAAAFDLIFCLDIGHLLFYRHDVGKHIQSFLPKSSMVHLHGVKDGQDHRGADHIPSPVWDSICRGLKEYRGVVSLEVFSLQDLILSLERVEEMIDE